MLLTAWSNLPPLQRSDEALCKVILMMLYGIDHHIKVNDPYAMCFLCGLRLDINDLDLDDIIKSG